MENARTFYGREDVLKDLKEVINKASWDYKYSNRAYCKEDCDKYIRLLDQHFFTTQEIKDCISGSLLALDLLNDRVREDTMTLMQHYNISLTIIAHDIAMNVIWQSEASKLFNTTCRIRFWQGIESVTFIINE